MKTAKLILLCLSGMLAMQSAAAQSRSEKKAQTERNVREAINADHYKINVDYMQPMKGRSRALTSDYSIEIRNDSVFSYLPYFGVAYNVPYGGGKGLIFNAPITGYRKESLKKGKTRIDFKTGNEEDKYEYSLIFRRFGQHTYPADEQTGHFILRRVGYKRVRNLYQASCNHKIYVCEYHSCSEKAGIAMAYRQNLLYTCKDHKQTFRHRMLHQVKEYLIFAIYSY